MAGQRIGYLGLGSNVGDPAAHLRAAKPEPPLPLAIQEVAVEVTQERTVDDADRAGG